MQMIQHGNAFISVLIALYQKHIAITQQEFVNKFVIKQLFILQIIL